MNRFILCLLTFLFSINLNAVEIISGSLNVLRNEIKIAISLDCSKCVYKANNKDLPFDYFLAKAPRDENWEMKSLEYFVDYFNEKTYNEGLLGFMQKMPCDAKYEMIIVPKYVYPNGDIKAYAVIKDVINGSDIAILSFFAEGDDDDKITLRDPLKEAGADIGNLFRKILRGKEIKKDYDDIYY